MNELFLARGNIISSKGLGKLKLESISKKAIFIAPKTYCLETIDGNFIYKVKGLNKDIPLTINDFEALLEKDSSIKKNQRKCCLSNKSLNEGTISILEQTYTLQQTDNKRELIYSHSSNQLIDTKPYTINSLG